jgi:hypothetical protein
MNIALNHMLGYLTEEQTSDAKDQGLENDTIHMLGYLDTPQWIDAYKYLNEKSELLALAKRVDNAYGTKFCSEMLSSTQPVLEVTQIVDNLMSDPQAYNEFIKAMLVAHLKSDVKTQIYWDAWFRGADGKDLEDADNGKIYQK